ncbi:MAG: hypothetical protein AAFN80_11350 [Pseudomonadota bacterium]
MTINRSEAVENLALVNTLASSLKFSLEDDLTQEDIAAGAEPLTREQIQAELDKICDLATTIAVLNLKAEPEEWLAAISKVE